MIEADIEPFMKEDWVMNVFRWVDPNETPIPSKTDSPALRKLGLFAL